jgi:hypothetical protein
VVTPALSRVRHVPSGPDAPTGGLRTTRRPRAGCVNWDCSPVRGWLPCSKPSRGCAPAVPEAGPIRLFPARQR